MRAKAIIATLPYVVKNQIEDLQYRVYVTDALYALAHGNMTKRYFDMLDLPKHEETRSGDEIAADIIKRMELTYESV